MRLAFLLVSLTAGIWAVLKTAELLSAATNVMAGAM